MKISKRNPLNAIYSYWLSLGGQPKTPEDLCHFMRVCFLWSWVRWLISFDFEIEERRELNFGCFNTVRRHRDRLPRVFWFMVATALILIGTELYANGIMLNVLMLIFGILILAIFVLGFGVGVRGVLKLFEGGDIHEGLKTFRDYSAAKKQRICPFIEVEK